MQARMIEKVMRENSENGRTHVHPSTELEPDVYEIPFDGTECVHIFVANRNLRQQCEVFLNTLRIEIPESNVHLMKSGDEIEETLKEVANCQETTSLLLVVFWGYSSRDGIFSPVDNSVLQYYKIWTPFLNETFRDKPKVFILNAIELKRLHAVDGEMVCQGLMSPYQAPNEADLLIIYKHNKSEHESISFIEEFATILKDHGEMEDLCSVVSIIDTTQYTRPVIISTLLKKLYIIESDWRGHHLNSERNYEEALMQLKKIDDILKSVDNPDKSSPSLMRKIRDKISSFRNKDSPPSPKSLKVQTDSEIQPKVHNPTDESISRKVSRDSTPGSSAERPIRKTSTVRPPAKKMPDEKKPWKP